MKIPVKLKKDRYSARRGGSSKALDIYCRRCNSIVIVYQKDGPGPLLRCYVDRIIYPKEYKQNIRDGKLEKLTCNDCDAIMGLPIRYKEHGEDRLAFNMVKSAFKKKISTSVRIK